MKDHVYDYVYDPKGDVKYCYPNSNVLINKFGMGEINMIHPFREGNGRSQRIYITYLCTKGNRYDINFDAASQEDMLEASVMSAKGDNSKLEDLIFKCMTEQSTDK